MLINSDDHVAACLEDPPKRAKSRLVIIASNSLKPSPVNLPQRICIATGQAERKMSSSQDFQPSSQASFAGPGRRSRFIYKHLSQLGLSSPSCPIRIIAHIDLDAFYAQCEGVRLGISEDQPLAVQVSFVKPSYVQGKIDG